MKERATLPTIQVSSGSSVKVGRCPTPQGYVKFVQQKVLSHPTTFFRKIEDCNAWVNSVIEAGFLSRTDAETIVAYARYTQDWKLTSSPESYCQKLSVILDGGVSSQSLNRSVGRWRLGVSRMAGEDIAQAIARFVYLCRGFATRK